MMQPEGFVNPKGANKVRKLQRGLSLKNSYSCIPLCCPEILYHFQSVICHPHIISEMLQSSPHFLVNTGFSKILYKSICFDHTIKVYIPTPRGLHQSINGSLELAHLVSTFWIDKTFWLHHIQLFFKISIKACSFDIHLPNFIIIKCGNC